MTEAAVLQMFYKIVVLKNFANSTGKHLCWSLFLKKVAGWRPATLLKRDSDTSVFLRISQFFLKTPFYRTPPGDCFCNVTASSKMSFFHHM